jgi:hypothetical protein
MNNNSHNEVTIKTNSLQTEGKLLLKQTTDIAEETTKIVQLKQLLQKEDAELHTKIKETNDFNTKMVHTISLQTNLVSINDSKETPVCSMNRIDDAMSNPPEPHHQMLSTNPSQQTERVPLATNTAESEYNETTFSPHHPPENSKGAQIDTLGDPENLDNANDATI